MDQGDGDITLVAHAGGEAQRGTVVLMTVVPDADDDAIRCPLFAAQLRSRRLNIDRVGASRRLRVLDHLTTFSACPDRICPSSPSARRSTEPIGLTGADT
jgi:hypothetical protein